MQLIKSALPGSIPFLLLAFFAGLILSQIQLVGRWGRRWLWGLSVLYLGFSMPAVSRALAAPLAWGLAPLQKAEQARGARAVVVLDGGTLRYRASEGLIEVPNHTASLRALEAARVSRLLGGPLVVVSGGDSAACPDCAPEASALRDALINLGVSPQRVVLDSDSLNTRAHALNLIRILSARGISNFVLVTSPTHMRRALSAFRAVGADPIPSLAASPLDDKRGWHVFWPSSEALLLVEQAIYDYFGLAYYWIRGWL